MTLGPSDQIRLHIASLKGARFDADTFVHLGLDKSTISVALNAMVKHKEIERVDTKKVRGKPGIYIEFKLREVKPARRQESESAAYQRQLAEHEARQHKCALALQRVMDNITRSRQADIQTAA